MIPLNQHGAKRNEVSNNLKPDRFYMLQLGRMSPPSFPKYFGQAVDMASRLKLYMVTKMGCYDFDAIKRSKAAMVFSWALITFFNDSTACS